MSGYYSMYEKFWEVLVGSSHPNLPREIPLITSLLYYSTALLLGRLLRIGVRELAPAKYKPYLFDAATTFQVLACSLENGQIKKHYGHGAYGIALFCLWFWVKMTSPEGRANPCSYMIAYQRGAITLRNFVTRTACMLAGGLSSYQFARVFWSLSLTDSHMERYVATHCVKDLSVSVPLGFSIETAATFLDTILCLNTFSSFALWEDITKCIFGVILTIYGVHLTGMYLNPLNATNQNFGCDGITAAEHISIYWVGPLLASAVATRSHDLITGDQSPAAKTRATSSAKNNNVTKNGKKSTQAKASAGKVMTKSAEVADDWVFVNSSDANSSETTTKTTTVTRRSLRNREILIAE